MSDKKTMWQSRVAEWRASGKTAEEFSTGQGYTAGTLRWWASRLRRDARSGRPTIRLARVARSGRTGSSEVASRPQGGVVIELLDMSARVLVETGVDRDTLGTVLEVMRAGGGQ